MATPPEFPRPRILASGWHPPASEVASSPQQATQPPPLLFSPPSATSATREPLVETRMPRSLPLSGSCSAQDVGNNSRRGGAQMSSSCRRCPPPQLQSPPGNRIYFSPEASAAEALRLRRSPNNLCPQFSAAATTSATAAVVLRPQSPTTAEAWASPRSCPPALRTSSVAAVAGTGNSVATSGEGPRAETPEMLPCSSLSAPMADLTIAAFANGEYRSLCCPPSDVCAQCPHARCASLICQFFTRMPLCLPPPPSPPSFLSPDLYPPHFCHVYPLPSSSRPPPSHSHTHASRHVSRTLTQRAQ